MSIIITCNYILNTQKVFFFLAALVILLERKKIRKKFPKEDFSKHYHAQNFSVVSDSIYFSSAIQ